MYLKTYLRPNQKYDFYLTLDFSNPLIILDFNKNIYFV